MLDNAMEIVWGEIEGLLGSEEIWSLGMTNAGWIGQSTTPFSPFIFRMLRVKPFGPTILSQGLMSNRRLR